MAAILPAPLGSVCQVGKLENQRLQLVVPSAAHAAKMRQLAPRIAQALADQGWNLNEIAVKVQAGLPKPGARKPLPPKEAQPLGDAALGAFETLHDNLRPGPLADAVARLLKHHKSS
ncbi:Zn-ribbon-containing RNA-binding protein [Achromobacter ruhlandii]|nr:Zn-ribbon-containing RNA-binding protein [Achromobacter ruhlandii]